MQDLTINLKDIPDVDRIEKVDLNNPENYAYVLTLKGTVSHAMFKAIQKQWENIFKTNVPKLLILGEEASLKRL
jgi:hypothetical protein